MYVELEAAPYVWRLQADGTVTAHTGVSAGSVKNCLMDEFGRLFLLTELGFGLVHTNDMLVASDAVEQGRWTPKEQGFAEMPAQWGYVLSPQARLAEA